MEKWLPRLHALVVGPGLGRDSLLLNNVRVSGVTVQRSASHKLHWGTSISFDLRAQLHTIIVGLQASDWQWRELCCGAEGNRGHQIQ